MSTSRNARARPRRLVSRPVGAGPGHRQPHLRHRLRLGAGLATLTPSTGFTFEAWVYLDNAPTGDKWIATRTRRRRRRLRAPPLSERAARRYSSRPPADSSEGRARLRRTKRDPGVRLDASRDDVRQRQPEDLHQRQTRSPRSPRPRHAVDARRSAFDRIGLRGERAPARAARRGPALVDGPQLFADSMSRKNRQIGYEPGLVSIWRFNGTYEDGIGGNDGSPVGSVPFTSGAPALQPILTRPRRVRSGRRSCISAMHDRGATDAVRLRRIDAGTEPGDRLQRLSNPPQPALPELDLRRPVLPGIRRSTNRVGHAAPTVTVPLIPSIEGRDVLGVLRDDECRREAPSPPSDTPVTTVITNPAPSIWRVSPATGPHTGGNHGHDRRLELPARARS